MDHKKEIIKLLREAASRHDMYQVFRDCMEAIALAISNTVDRKQYAEREARYMSLIKPYTRDELMCFARIRAHLVDAFEVEYRDHLGEIFMELDLGNDHRGQYFTPYEVCKFMAQLSLDGNLMERIRADGFILLSEPAVGAGGMVIAACQTLRQRQVSFQQRVHYTCVDVDEKAVHMAYIQLSLIGLPAIVVQGNTLTLEERAHWYTPFHVIGGWDRKLRRTGPALTRPAVMPDPAPVSPAPSTAYSLQPELF